MGGTDASLIHLLNSTNIRKKKQLDYDDLNEEMDIVG